jgi:hypothetical protein
VNFIAHRPLSTIPVASSWALVTRLVDRAAYHRTGLYGVRGHTLLSGKIAACIPAVANTLRRSWRRSEQQCRENERLELLQYFRQVLFTEPDHFFRACATVGNAQPSFVARTRTVDCFRLRAAAARTSETPCATRAFSRSSSSGLQRRDSGRNAMRTAKRKTRGPSVQNHTQEPPLSSPDSPQHKPTKTGRPSGVRHDLESGSLEIDQ